MALRRNAATVGAILLLSLLAVLSRTKLAVHQGSAKVARYKTKESNQSSRSCSGETDWGSISADKMTPEQMFKYLHWTNRKACFFVQDFGGVVVTDPYKWIDGQKVICMDPEAQFHGLSRLLVRHQQ
jgi:hypothetical protein